MKKYSISVLLGKKSRLIYKQKRIRPIILRANLPVGTAIKTPSLGSMLGTYGVSTDPFLETFNKISTQFWPIGTLIPIIIFISPTKTYIIEYYLPTVLYLYNLVLKFEPFKKKIPSYDKLIATYKITLLKKQKIRLKKSTIKEVLGCLYSAQIHDVLRKVKRQFNFKRRKKKK